MEYLKELNVAGVANVMLTKEQVIENLTVKATTKYKSYVAAYVEKYTADDSKVKKSLEQLYNMDEKTLNTALRNFINGDTVKDADDVIRRIKNSNLTADDIKKLAEWAKVEYDAVKDENMKNKFRQQRKEMKQAQENLRKLQEEMPAEMLEALLKEEEGVQ